MITCYEDGWDTAHEGQMGSIYTLTNEEEYYDPVLALREVVLEVTGYEPPADHVRRIGFL